MNTYWLDLSYYFFNFWFNENRQEITNEDNDHSLLYDTLKLFIEQDIWQSINPNNFNYNEVFCENNFLCILFCDDMNNVLIETKDDIANKITGINYKIFNEKFPKRFRTYIDGLNIRIRDIYICVDNTVMIPTTNTQLIENFLNEEELNLLYDIYLMKSNEQIISDIIYDDILNEMNNMNIDIDVKMFKLNLEIYLLYMTQNIYDKFDLITIYSELLNEYNSIVLDNENLELKYKFYRLLNFIFFIYSWKNIFKKYSHGYKYVFSW